MELSKDLVAASATPMILAILEEQDSYGYAIIKKVRDISKDEIQWTDGMLYPVLHRLEKQKWISSYWEKSPTGRKRKYYRITRDGIVNLRNIKEQWQFVNKTLNEVWNNPSKNQPKLAIMAI